MSDSHTDAALRRILETTRTIAMVGASPNPDRDSYRVMRYLQQQGYRVIPVNPTVDDASILGEPVVGRLADIEGGVDLVDVFRRADAVAGVVDEVLALASRPATLWLQLGVVDEQAAARARDAGLEVVMDRCIKVEHGRLVRPASG